jgi:predicted HicB family RNase H-like nuclease
MQTPLAVRIPLPLRQAVEQAAMAQGVSISAFVRQVLERAVRQQMRRRAA